MGSLSKSLRATLQRKASSLLHPRQPLRYTDVVLTCEHVVTVRQRWRTRTALRATQICVNKPR